KVRQPLYPVGTRQRFGLEDQNGTLVGYIAHEKGDPNNGDNQIKLRVPPVSGQATWKIKLDNQDTHAVDFHAWIERDDHGQSVFLSPTPSSAVTLSSLACGQETLVVAAEGFQSGTAAAFSAAGPTRDGRLDRVHVLAPGVEIPTAQARSR